MLRVLLAALASLSFLPVEAARQITPLFSMTMAAPPGYGFAGANPDDGASGQSLNDGVYYTYTNRAATGPSGGNAAEVAMIGVTPTVSGGANPCTGTASTCEGYVGWGYPSPVFSAITQGQSLYVRFYFRVTAFSDPRRANPTSAAWGGKMIMVGDGGGDCSDDTQRFFWNFRSASAGSSTRQFELDRNIEGVGFTATIADGNWHAYQGRLLSSSTYPGGNDARIYLWTDNDTFASPTVTSGAFDWSSVCYNDNLRLGGYMTWLSDAVGGNAATYQFGAFVIDDAFDASWFANMGVAAGATGPLRLRRPWLE